MCNKLKKQATHSISYLHKTIAECVYPDKNPKFLKPENDRMVYGRFTWKSYAVRLLLATALVMTTYNPTGLSYLHWIIAYSSELIVFKILVGLVISLFWLLFIHAAMRSLGKVGLFLVVLFFGLFFWLIFGGFVISNKEQEIEFSSSWLQWVIVLTLSFVLSVGISWSHLKKWLVGLYDVDDMDN